ncbi:hypothetical protein [Paraburkholderia mimosarum]|uniref:hypothetical protein n=1 Tax=Paraburkholderia mimosarum TaxID=312026 RepID=UPI0006855F15|nr:hypothetical protein [Paraburkholderia mimosarum]
MNTLEAKVQKVLIQEWDPIGVKDIPEAQDEYDMYVPGICRMLRAGQSNMEVYSHLRWIEMERIGLEGDEQHTQRIAAKLVGLLP